MKKGMKLQFLKMTKVLGKRKAKDVLESIAKKGRCPEGPVGKEEKEKTWVTASDIRNFMLKDTLVDWLKLYEEKQAVEKNDFFEFILDRGIKFELYCVEELKRRFPEVKITSVSAKITKESCEEAKKLISQKVPIIHSVPFENEKNYTRGIIDLLIRSDYVNQITSSKVTGLREGYYYPFDIKFSTLHLTSDGLHLTNSGNIPFYKAQLSIYTEALGSLQGYVPNKAFLIGRRQEFMSRGKTTKSILFDRLGVVDFYDVDIEYRKKTKEAIKWVRELRKEGKNWTVFPPSRMELYPNMSRESDFYQTQKKELAEKLGDITMLWNCGVKAQEIAIESGITSWRDPRCTAALLGLKGKRGDILDEILKINRNEDPEVKINQNLVTDFSSDLDACVDLENFCDIFGSFSEQEKTDKLFMIGVYHKDKNQEVVYKNFTIRSFSDSEVKRIIKEFEAYLRENNIRNLWYWYADHGIWSRECARLGINTKIPIESWRDLHETFLTNNIAIKGCFGYGLKEVAKCMKDHRMIEASLSSNCKSGLEAGLKAYLALTEGEGNEKNKNIMEDIKEYNKFDVQVLWEILEYFS